MANPKILEQKQTTIDEIKDKFSNAASSVFFEYAGLTVADDISAAISSSKVVSKIEPIASEN